MRESVFKGLCDYKVKRVALIVGFAVLLLDISTYLLPREVFKTNFPHIIFQGTVILSFIFAINSRDKIDDEISTHLRYSVSKIILSFTFPLLVILAFLHNSFKVESFNTSVLLYFLECYLVAHIVLYHIGRRFNVSWLLEETKLADEANKSMKILLIAMGVMAIITFIITMI